MTQAENNCIHPPGSGHQKKILDKPLELRKIPPCGLIQLLFPKDSLVSLGESVESCSTKRLENENRIKVPKIENWLELRQNYPLEQSEIIKEFLDKGDKCDFNFSCVILGK